MFRVMNAALMDGVHTYIWYTAVYFPSCSHESVCFECDFFSLQRLNTGGGSAPLHAVLRSVYAVLKRNLPLANRTLVIWDFINILNCIVNPVIIHNECINLKSDPLCCDADVMLMGFSSLELVRCLA